MYQHRDVKEIEKQLKKDLKMLTIGSLAIIKYKTKSTIIKYKTKSILFASRRKIKNAKKYKKIKDKK